jgi:hypothetical protein
MSNPNPYPPDAPYYRDGVEVLIPYKNGSSLVAYYCGVFALIPVLALILAPIALVFGIRGVQFASKNPRAGGSGHSIAGIVLGSICALLNYGVVFVFLYFWLFGRG